MKKISKRRLAKETKRLREEILAKCKSGSVAEQIMKDVIAGRTAYSK